MSDFDQAIQEHIYLYKEGIQDKYYQGAKWAWQHQQAKIDELQKENAALVHVIKSRDIQLENEKHEYDELVSKLVDSKMKNTKLQKRIDEYKKLTTSIRNEFDLWSDDSEFADVIEAQIENLEALRGGS